MCGWPDRIPDGIEPIVAYRMWGYTLTHGGAQLHSLTCSGTDPCPWEAAESSWVVASCVRQSGPRHIAPDENCSCGLYAIGVLPQSLEQAPITPFLLGLVPVDGSDEDGMVLGRVELAGKIIEHEHGYRAERARIAELVPFEGTERDVMRLGARLGLPIGRPVAPPSTDSLTFSPDSVKRMVERILEAPAANGAQAMAVCPPPAPHSPLTPRATSWASSLRRWLAVAIAVVAWWLFEVGIVSIVPGRP